MNSEPVMGHDDAAELLPWLVNGSLPDDERPALEAHVRDCVHCRGALREQQALYARLRETAHQDAPDMRRINRRIDAHDERRRSGRLRALLRRWLASPWRVAVVAQSVALVVLAGVLLSVVQRSPEPSTYTTLGNVEELPSGDYLRIVFRPDLAPAEIEAVLDLHGLQQVRGPSVRGMYTARAVAADPDPALVGRLRAHDAVLLAEPMRVGDAP